MKKAAIRQAGMTDDSYGAVLGDISELIDAARRSAARSVNSLMTATYWLIGRRIVQGEQRGEVRAEYGEELVERLAADLSPRFGRGFSERNVWQMKTFCLAWPSLQTSSAEFPGPDILQTASAESRTGSPSGAGKRLQTVSGSSSVFDIARRFPLPWSAHVRLLAANSEEARRFYEAEVLRGGGTVRSRIFLPAFECSTIHELRQAASSRRSRPSRPPGRSPRQR